MFNCYGTKQVGLFFLEYFDAVRCEVQQVQPLFTFLGLFPLPSVQGGGGGK